MKRVARVMTLALAMAMAACALCACGGAGAGNSADAGVGTGAGAAADGQTSKEDAEMALTEEYVLANSSLTEQDLAEVDFEDFVAYLALFDVDQEKPDGETLARLFESYKKTRSVERGESYAYVFDDASGKLSDADIDGIRTLVWQRNEGTYMETMVLDFSGGVAYYGTGDFLDSCTEAKRIAAPTSAQMADVVAALRESGISGWENSYVGTSEGTTGHYVWAVGLELADGRCVKYSGSGVMDSGTPAELEELLDALRAEFAG